MGRPSKGSLRNNDVIFGTLVHDAEATIVAEQGLVLLKVEGESSPFFLPEGVGIPAEAYGEKVSITIRNITREVILELGDDDFYEDELASHSNLLLIDNWYEIKQLLEESKLSCISKNTKSFTTCLAGITLSIVSFYLLSHGFQFPQICFIGVGAGLLTSIICIVKPLRELFRAINTNVIRDKVNHYINVDTGETNLNGGIRIPNSAIYSR